VVQENYQGGHAYNLVRLNLAAWVPEKARGAYFRGECERASNEGAGLTQLNFWSKDPSTPIGNNAAFRYHIKGHSREGNKDNGETQALVMMDPEESSHIFLSTALKSRCTAFLTGYHM
jgi:hypothetical protein